MGSLLISTRAPSSHPNTNTGQAQWWEEGEGG